MTSGRIARIISGGQSGVDRAALDAAIGFGTDYGGWCPLGGWAEDLPEPPGLLAVYPLMREASSPEPSVRTRLNVRDSHATLIVRSTGPSPGTDLAKDHAAALLRPQLVVSGAEVDAVLAWLESLPREITLNVAGPRESEQPGVYQETLELIRSILGGARR